MSPIRAEIAARRVGATPNFTYYYNLPIFQSFNFKSPSGQRGEYFKLEVAVPHIGFTSKIFSLPVISKNGNSFPDFGYSTPVHQLR
jgi:hypothetical protein